MNPIEKIFASHNVYHKIMNFTNWIKIKINHYHGTFSLLKKLFSIVNIEQDRREHNQIITSCNSLVFS